MGSPANHAAALRLESVSRLFLQGETEVRVLQGLDLELKKAQVAALIGVSGSGKSTLLHLAGLLERPSAGEVHLFGEATGDLGDNARTRIRRDKIGFVYQFHLLLSEFSAAENVMLPQLFAGRSRKAARSRALELLEAVGLGHRERHHPVELSGGEQQRVAIARALANTPMLVLADEPTGNLDEATADHVFDAFLGMVRAAGASALVATHDRRLSGRMDRVLALHGGRIEEEGGPAQG